MRVPRIHVSGPLETGAEIALEGAAANHLRVLRLRVGHPLIVFDGAGVSHHAQVVAVEKRRAAIRVREALHEAAESPLATTLVQGISKGDRMDWTIQKAVELGVHRIVPVITARSVVNTEPARLQKKHAHWQGVVVSACEQCGRNVLPALEAPVPLAQQWSHLPDIGRLFLDPEGGERLSTMPPPGTAGCTLLVGPEGGLNDNEAAVAREHAFRPVALGPRVLRTETAGVTALAALQVLWGDLA
ncbi:16S rRNA (uracil(1498)-N(3))-methyltransferase [Aquisalimonas sp. 2447]|uniref:16S rRNA (uracil(1498)-N(3))-methyltransferase n=1 Tax=Aquisalimonas sp. 2447 TaxID=2740807 RepID=UPI001432312E|nr:16S rRNA (uracil(1498)-N(3))-methyltransferase [Aquisalimonas sp. 2447]QIT54201.1 16S rRNA (uracil(1498)-N(3))-methyltransferase [Aquisalimonas sp. 2447]